MGEEHATGLLVVGHGTRNQHGLHEYWDLLEQIAQRLPATPIQGCFLELAQPDIHVAIERLARHGVREVAVMPLMLFEAGHAKVDIPQTVRSAALKTGLTIHMLQALNDHPRMLELSALRYRSTLQQHGVASKTARTVLVGRGSRDRHATKQFREFLAQRMQLTGEMDGCGAFMAMAEPRVETVLERCRQEPHQLMVVQPHLLFSGALLDRLRAMVAEQNRRSVRQRWLMVDHLGAHPLVADTVLERFSRSSSPQKMCLRADNW